MINKIAFTGREDLLVDALAMSTGKIGKKVEPYICESTIIHVTEPVAQKVSKFENPYEIVNIVEPKVEAAAEEVIEGPHINFFG